MNNEVTFSVKILMDGQEKFVQATASSKDLSSAIDQVSTHSRKLNDELMNTNQRVAAFQNLFAGMQQIVDVTKQMTDMYANAEVANTKLTTVMRQRMGAQAEDLQQVQQVIAAQKELGVISGTVQTAGAQQLATFLNQKSSLETLIPAMNNLVAQQNGLNATQEDATSIGNMMGKAMQGQTEVLQRVGVTFTDAQKQIIKYGNEQQRAATLAQVIKDNVGEMNAELAKTDAGEAKKRTMWFDSLRVSIGSTMSTLQPFLATFNQIGMASFALIQVKNGFMGIAGAVSLSTIATSAHTLATRICTAAQNFHKTAMVQLTAATGSATVAATALSAAYTMGLSVAITGIVALISHLCNSENDATKDTKALTSANDDAKSKQQELTQTMTDARSGLSIMINKLKEFHGSKEQEKKLINECNTKYGEAMGYYASVSDWYKVLVANSETYCAQLVNEARMRQLADQAAKAEQTAHNIKYNQDGSKKQYSTQRQYKDDTSNGSTAAETVIVSHTQKEIVGSSQQEKASRAYTSAIKESQNAQKQMNDLVKENGKLQEKVHAEVKGTHQYDNMQQADASGKKTKTKKTKDDDVLRENAKSYADLEHNIDVYQKRIDKANPSETQQIKNWSDQIVKAKAAQMAIKEMQAEYSKPAELKTLQDYDTEISRQEGLLKTADESKRKSITANISNLKKQRQAMEDASQTAPVMSEIKTYDDLNDAIGYYQNRLSRADATARPAINAQIKLLTDLKDKWEAADKEADKPAALSKLNTLKEIDAALNYYQTRLQTANSSEVTGIQASINALELKRKLMNDIAGISTSRGELNDLKGMGAQELKIKLKAIGLDEIQAKIRNLQKLANNSATDPSQKKEIQQQVQEWTKYEKQLKKNQVTIKGAYNSVKSVGSGIKSLSTVLKGGGNAWEKMTGIIDAAIEIYEGVSSVISIVKTISSAATASQAADSAVQITANSAEGASWSGLMAAKTAAAYADIPFAGTALAAAAVAANQAMIIAAAVPKFADGCIAYGPTLGIFGEYAGASSNPEVVAPLDKLQQMVAPQGSGIGGKVRFEIKGRKLAGVLQRENNIRQRS